MLSRTRTTGPAVVPSSKQLLGHARSAGARRTELKSMSRIPPAPLDDSCARIPTTRRDSVELLAELSPHTMLLNTCSSLLGLAVAASRSPTTRPPALELLL